MTKIPSTLLFLFALALIQAKLECPPNCLICADSGICSQCSRDLLLYQNRCIYMDRYCLQIDDSGNCLRCTQGLVPDGNKCVYYQPFCENYGNDRMCNRTFSQFELRPDVTAQAKQEYRIFILSANQAKPTSPILSSIKMKSFSDTKGSYSSAGVIQFYPSLSISSKSIKTIRSDYLIVQCKQEFALQSGMCIKRQLVVVNCQEYNAITSECILCQKGYDMNLNSKCEIRSEKTCSERDLNLGNCLKCNGLNGYVNAGGWCISKQISRNRDSRHFQVVQMRIMWPLLPNCYQQNSISYCQVCLSRYMNVEGKCILYQKNCESYHALGFCQKCQKGYSFEGGNCVPINCGQECLSCKPGFQYQSGKCFPVKQPNCAIYSNSDCVICQSQYFLNSATKKCQPSMSNCALMNETSLQCRQCSFQYILFRERCILQISNCNDYSLDGRCIKCESMYQLRNDSCVKMPARCARLGKSDMCQLCEPGYSLFRIGNGYECVLFKDTCKAYDRTGRCSACIENYSLKNDFCQLAITIPNCKQVNIVTKKCEKCSEGYQSMEGICVIWDANCKEYKNGLCSICLSGFYKGENNSCLPNPVYCESYNNQEKRCDHCIPRYLMAEGRCIAKSIILNGCVDQNRDEPSCQSCQQGFKLKNELCYALNCLTYTIERNCLQCPTYYRKSKTNQRICQPHFCKSYSKGPSCDTFEPGYIGGFAVQQYGKIVVEYCKEYDKANNCIKCEKNRFLQLNPGTKYSICLPSNCANSNQMKCSQCSPGFSRIQPGLCVVDNCVSFNENGLCEACDTQYSLNRATNLCQFKSKLCLETDSNKTCSKCIMGYVLNNRKNCVLEIKGCRSYGAYCYACTKGLEYKDGACKAINCDSLKQNDSTICQRCKPGNELTQEGLCRPKNCEMFSQEGWACNGCLGRYTLLKGLCSPRNCAMFSPIDQIACLLCQQNFDLVDGGCLHRNCVNPKDITCKNCIEGWIPDYRRLCVVRDCLSIEPKSGLCSSCQSGKRLLKGLCVRDRCLSRPSNIINQCTLCETSFYLANQRQYCVAYFCKDWDPSNGECWSCAENFALENGRCVNKICKRFDNSNPLMTVCDSCPEGFNPYSQYCVPEKCQKQSYNPLTAECQKCIFGYEPTDGICKLSNCHEFKQNSTDYSTCEKCRLGFTDHGGLCLPSNCQQFLPSTTKCSKCSDGFYLFSDICLAVNCQIFDDDGQCTKCQSLYKLTSASTCSRANCEEDTLDTCLKCEDGYEVNQHTGGFCQPVNCEHFLEENNTCKKCWEGFNKDNGICKDLHCQSYSSIYGCLKCRLGFTFSTKELCQLAYPNFCPLGQYYSEAKQICQKIPIPNCKYTQYNSPNVCIDCMQGYFLQNGYCYSVKGCSRYSLVSGCISCEDGYKLVDRKCLTLKDLLSNAQKDAGCEIVRNNGQCDICKKGFTKSSNNKCTNLSENCIEASDKGACLKCKDKWHLRFDGLCYQNSEYCVEANLMGHCVKCSTGFQLNNAKCVKQQPSIVAAPELAKQETPPKKEQIPLIKNSSPDAEDNNVPYTDNCLFQDDLKEACVICNSSYYITSKGKCLPIPPYCKFVNMRGMCFLCQDGYTLDKNNCVQNKSTLNSSKAEGNGVNLRNQWK